MSGAKMAGVRNAPAIGHTDRPGLRRVMIAFDEETFAEIRERAVKAETSFAEQVRQLVEWGLEVK